MKNTTQNAEIAVTSGAFEIENVYPLIDGGRYAVKRIAGEPIDVWADVYRDGHDVIEATLKWRKNSGKGAPSPWRHIPMVHHNNDRWTATFTPQELGGYHYAIDAWTAEFATWQKGFKLKIAAGLDVSLDAMEGLDLLARATVEPSADSAVIVRARDSFIRHGDTAVLCDPELAAAMGRCEARPDLTTSPAFPLTIDRERARYSTWYEMVPRSQSAAASRHGTFRDCIARLPDIAAMGFDVLYFTPIHPIGVTNRKGRNNSLTSQPGDPGSPYAIGGTEGGHDAIHPELGTMSDFQALCAACADIGMEVALDIAVQCSLDHPWLKDHPEWFKHRPDGSMKYAENPPKKYEDIVNPDMTGPHAVAIWNALRDVLLFWVDHGVKIFRVDNPHTKPFRFWEWVIADIRRDHPDVIFLAEAFTRPKVMKGLAKLGFTQSYTYFTWRTGKQEFEEYLNELTGYPERDFYRPNFFVNTPDILPYHLQGGEPWQFKSRLALAALLSSTYGIYNGFELLEHTPLPGREEYLDSEKYEIRVRDWNAPGNIKDFITAINQARRANPALQQTSNLRFIAVDDAAILGFVKRSGDGANVIAAAIAVGPEAREVWLPINAQIIVDGERRDVTRVENLLTSEHRQLEWGGLRVWLDPQTSPIILFRCHA